jgi:hypothetical protein
VSGEHHLNAGGPRITTMVSCSLGRRFQMRFLLQIAAVALLVWVVLSLIGAVFGGLIHLLWIVILVALAVWLWQFLTRGSDRQRAGHRRMW